MSAAENEPSIYCAVRIDGETDAIAFYTRAECAEFCQRRPEYEFIHTGIYTLAGALELFGGAE